MLLSDYEISTNKDFENLGTEAMDETKQLLCGETIGGAGRIVQLGEKLPARDCTPQKNTVQACGVDGSDPGKPPSMMEVMGDYVGFLACLVMFGGMLFEKILDKRNKRLNESFDKASRD